MNKTIPAGLITLGAFLIFSSNVRSETLTEAIDQVIKTNPQVRSQAFNRLARDHQVVQAKSGYYPTLDVVVGAGVAEYREPVDDTFNPLEVVISLRQNVFTGFATANEIDRQQARVKSSAYSLQSIAENLALTTSRAYMDVLRNEELKNIAQENLETHLRIMDQIKLRSESGVGSQVDTDQVSSRLSLAQSNIIVAQTNLLDAYTNYMAVTDHLPKDLSLPDAPEGKIPASLEEAEKMALAGHPTLKSATADLEARQEQYEVAKAPYYPIIDLEVDQRWEDEIDGVEQRQDSLTAMARLRYNLFNGWQDDGRKAETLELVSEAREIRNNTQRQVVESIRLSWMAYQSVLQRIEYLKNHIEASTATARAYAKQFDIGKRTLLDVLDTEAEAINARIDMVNAQYDGFVAQYRILNGMGSLVHSFGLDWPRESIIENNGEMTEDQENVAVK